MVHLDDMFQDKSARFFSTVNMSTFLHIKFVLHRMIDRSKWMDDKEAKKLSKTRKWADEFEKWIELTKIIRGNAMMRGLHATQDT